MEQQVRPKRRLGRAAKVVIAAIVALVTASCSPGSGGDPSHPGPDSAADIGASNTSHAAGDTAAPPRVSSSATAGSQSGGGTAACSQENSETLLAAAKVALRTITGGTVISIESERGGEWWEVRVLAGDGTEHEVELSSDGTRVVSGPTVKQETAADRAKRRDQVAAAKLNYRAAIDKLCAEVPDGRISELDLDTHRGAIVWEADMYDSAGIKHEFNVDATTGKVTKK